MQLILTHNGTEIARGAAGSTISISGLTISPALDGWTYDHPDFVSEEIFEPDEDGELVSLGWTERSPLDPPSGHYALVAVPEEPPVEFEPLTPEQARYLMPVIYPTDFARLLAGLVTENYPEGVLPSDVEAIIAAIPDDRARELARWDFNRSTEFERVNPLIDQIGTVLGLTPEQIDTAWMGFAAA